MKTKKGPKTPEQQLRLNAIEQALKNGCRLKGFSLGNGLRVINIEKAGKLKVYGASTEVLKALKNINDACAQGRKPYNTHHGAKNPRYLTGQIGVSCRLDKIVRLGEDFEIHFENGLFVARYKTVEYSAKPPYHIMCRAMAKGTKEPEIYQRYGYTYRATPPYFGGSWSVSIIGRPKGYGPGNGAAFDVTYTGKGLTIGAAIHNMLTNTGRADDRCS